MERLILREAKDTDCDILFQWINDEETRKNSFQTKKISYQDHVRWFQGKMQNPACRIFILLRDEKEAGQIRLDGKENVVEISYNIAAKYRGLGLGSEILKLVEAFARGKVLLGRVKKGNIASGRCFEKNGYEKREKSEWLEYWKKIES